MTKLPKLTALASAAFMISIFVFPVSANAQTSVAEQPAQLEQSVETSATASQDAPIIPTAYGLPTTLSEIRKASHCSDDAVPMSLREVFDSDYYAANNPDVVSALGDDPEVLYQHFITYGIKEGRIGSIVLDVAKYRAMYPDLDAVFGDNWDAYVAHYFSFGVQEGRWNGFSLKQAQKVGNRQASETEIEKKVEMEMRRLEDGSYTDDAGSIIIPWDNVVKFHYITMEELETKLGDSMVLMKDKDGNITFVGGTFTDAKVTDEVQAKEALRSMMKLMNFPEDTCELHLVNTHKDSLGNSYYRFSSKAKDSEEGRIDLYGMTDIIIGAGQDGTVLCMSTNNSANYTEMGNTAGEVLEIDMDKFNALVAAYEAEGVKNGIASVEHEPKYRYVSNANINGYRYYIVIHGTDGTVGEFCIVEQDGQYGLSGEMNTYNEATYGTDKQTPEDDLFNGEDAGKVTLYDVYGQAVTLDVLRDENGYYLCDKARNIAVLTNMDAKGSGSPNYSIMNRYTKETPEAFGQLLDQRFVTALHSIQETWDRYKEVGFWENRTTPILVSLNDVSLENTFEASVHDAIIFNVYKNDVAVSRDLLAHEFTHGVLSAITGGIEYENDTGAINEAFADVLGNLLEMMAYEAAGRDKGVLGPVDLVNWSMNESGNAYTKAHWQDQGRANEEITSAGREFADPTKYGMPWKIEDIGYIPPIKAGTGSNDNDQGGVHKNSSILNHIAYRMHTELGMNYQELFAIWYDALPLLTEDSKLSSIESYLTYSLNLHGHGDNAEGLHQFFEEARLSGRENETIVWRTVKPAEGARLAMLVDSNKPDASISSDDFLMWLQLTDGTLAYLTQDTEGANGVLIADTQEAERVSIGVLRTEDNGLDNNYIAEGIVNKDASKNSRIAVDMNDVMDNVLTRIGDSEEVENENGTVKDKIKQNFTNATQTDLKKYRHIYLIQKKADGISYVDRWITRAHGKDDPSDVEVKVVPRVAHKYNGFPEEKNMDIFYLQLREGITYLFHAEASDENYNSGLSGTIEWTVGKAAEQIVQFEVSLSDADENGERQTLIKQVKGVEDLLRKPAEQSTTDEVTETEVSEQFLEENQTEADIAQMMKVTTQKPCGAQKENDLEALVEADTASNTVTESNDTVDETKSGLEDAVAAEKVTEDNTTESVEESDGKTTREPVDASVEETTDASAEET